MDRLVHVVLLEVDRPVHQGVVGRLGHPHSVGRLGCTHPGAGRQGCMDVLLQAVGMPGCMDQVHLALAVNNFLLQPAAQHLLSKR